MWINESNLYQIYPLGFCGAPPENDGNTVPRIRKVTEWSGYLQALGIDTVLFNPVFESDSHGYDTRDFRRLDCRLGTNEDFRAVTDDLHAHGIRVLLDGVFNHVGRGFWAFQDVREHRQNSPYKDWFYIDFGRESNYGDGFWYEGWEGHYELVRLNLQNPEVRDYLTDSVRFWVEAFDIDGLRLDVAYCLDENFLRHLHWFVREPLREVLAGRPDPDFPLIGEILFGDYRRIVNGEMLDSCTNYECYKGLYSSFNSGNMFEIAHSLNRQFGPEDWCLYRGMHMVSFLDNHDVNRIASTLINPAHLKPAYGLMTGMPGIPCIYYGSEWGAAGVRHDGSDADLRPCFSAPRSDDETVRFVTRLLTLRHSPEAHPLRFGDYRNVVITSLQLVFARTDEQGQIYVCVNASDSPFTAGSDELRGNFRELISGQDLALDGSVEIPGYGVLWLRRMD